MRDEEFRVNYAAIVGMYEDKPFKFGEVYLYDDGSASVYDDFWCDPTRYCESHGQAMRVIVTRIVEDCELVW